MNNYNIVSILLLISLVQIYGTPILPYEHAIKTSAIRDHALQKGTALFDQASKKGVTGEQAVSGFAEDEGKKYEHSQADGHYDHADAFKKAHELAGNFNDENFHKIQGGSLADAGKKLSHKKGHHKSGFHNSYHKDESSANSSFYDDANDEGGEQYYNSNKGIYGDAAQKAIHGGHVDNKILSNGVGEHAGYHKGNDYESEHGGNKKYNQGQYYDDRNQHAVSNLGNQYGEHGIAQEQAYKHQIPGYYGGAYPPTVVAKTIPVAVPVPTPVVHQPIRHPAPVYNEPKITIYEDPRYPYEQGAYYDDRIDYKPAHYYNQQPAYDYYY